MANAHLTHHAYAKSQFANEVLVVKHSKLFYKFQLNQIVMLVMITTMQPLIVVCQVIHLNVILQLKKPVKMPNVKLIVNSSNNSATKVPSLALLVLLQSTFWVSQLNQKHHQQLHHAQEHAPYQFNNQEFHLSSNKQSTYQMNLQQMKFMKSNYSTMEHSSASIALNPMKHFQTSSKKLDAIKLPQFTSQKRILLFVHFITSCS
ncbi:hypothetical protein TRFO_11695 [Tritrichomonas foetus]|uniref:Uncharacterized protein n=1 Tax=Tritrichomonas foetus TaxID=1144522 RepID=A0A1J4J1X5_9EUKA|nr:hypothetical protein TRFO_11695 [Tritrichomonas foetus]|eukprot:OHS93502.1 hypothetical protein TRFO_11695 [Tritrichomonas foetus]